MKLKQAARDVLEVDRIELSAFDLAEEVIERIVAALASLEVIGILRGGAVVSHWAVTWVLASLEDSVVSIPSHGRCMAQDAHIPELGDAAGSTGSDGAGQYSPGDLASQERSTWEGLVLSDRDHSMRRCSPHLEAFRSVVDAGRHWAPSWESA